MKEIALFYEDFLTEKDASGHYIYRPSISPEVRSETVEGMLVSDNSTIDVSVAKELLTNLIAGCEVLGYRKAECNKVEDNAGEHAPISDRSGWRPVGVVGWLIQT